MNMIQSAKDQIAVLTRSAYRAAVQEGLLPDGVETVPAVEIPKDTANGDYTTTFCLAASKAMRKNPREVANILTQHMKLDGTYFTSVEIAGPGFLNFRLGEKWYADVVEDVEREADAYGRGEGLKGKKYMVEFVSANPTGPMHMGNARGGVLGDTLASVLDWSGANVWREFYVNDFGNQIEKFAKSIEARYFQLIKSILCTAKAFPARASWSISAWNSASSTNPARGSPWAIPVWVRAVMLPSSISRIIRTSRMTYRSRSWKR